MGIDAELEWYRRLIHKVGVRLIKDDALTGYIAKEEGVRIIVIFTTEVTANTAAGPSGMTRGAVHLIGVAETASH